jgi:hypothetical protein
MKPAPIEPDDADAFEKIAKRAKTRVDEFNKKNPNNQWTVTKGENHAPIEPDDAQVKPARPRDVPSGKFADKRKGINMGDIK